jgi:hypothetical protein
MGKRFRDVAGKLFSEQHMVVQHASGQSTMNE